MQRGTLPGVSQAGSSLPTATASGWRRLRTRWQSAAAFSPMVNK